MTAYVYQGAAKQDGYFMKLARYLEQCGVAPVDQSMAQHQLPSGSYRTLDQVRDDGLNIDNDLHLRLDAYFQQGWVDRGLSESGEYLYCLRAVDNSYTHLSAAQYMLINRGQSYEAKLLRALPKPSAADIDAKEQEWDQIREPVAYEYARLLMTLSHYTEQATDALHQQLMQALCQDPQVIVNPIARMRSQWVLGHVQAQCPETAPYLRDAWQFLWTDTPLPKPAVDTQLPAMSEKLQAAGWVLADQYDKRQVWHKPLWSLDEQSRSNASITLEQVGQAIRCEATALWGAQNQLNTERCVVGPGASLNAMCGFDDTLHAVKKRMESHPWIPAPGMPQQARGLDVPPQAPAFSTALRLR